jgi:hypothetical protein
MSLNASGILVVLQGTVAELLPGVPRIPYMPLDPHQILHDEVLERHIYSRLLR